MRPQPVVLPILRDALHEVAVVSEMPDIDYRTFPLVSIRRAGGIRLRRSPRALSLPILEVSAFSAEGLPEAEELYEQVLDALYEAQRTQTVVAGVGHLHSVAETRGAAQAPSPFTDTWAVEGAVRLGVRNAS